MCKETVQFNFANFYKVQNLTGTTSLYWGRVKVCVDLGPWPWLNFTFSGIRNVKVFDRTLIK